MAKTQAEWKATLANARKKAKSGFDDVKPTLQSAGVGGASQYVGDMLAERIDFLKDKWYGSPLAKILVAGGIRKRKGMANNSHALAGAGGFELALNYKISQFQQGKGDNPIRVFEKPEPKAQAQGQLPAAQADAQVSPVQAQIDAGALVDTFDDPDDDTGSLQEDGDEEIYDEPMEI